jgi:hypothetical protein
MSERREVTVTEPNISTFARFLVGFGSTAIVVFAILLIFQSRITGCVGYGYSAGTFLASCLSPTYGDYEHAAFAVPTEASAAHQAETAQVVIFGHSHSQVAFSADPTRRYFTGRGASYYLLAFSGEFSSFYDFLLQRLRLRPKVLVIDVSPFFTGSGLEMMSTAGRFVAEHPLRAAIQNYVKRLWQIPHSLGCGSPSWSEIVCGTKFATFRAISDGRLIVDYSLIFGKPLPRHPVTFGQHLDPLKIRLWRDNARAFYARHKLNPECTILTAVPSGTDFEEAAMAIAEEVGSPYIRPIMDGLSTIDGAHLDELSAATWSERFWQQSEPVTNRCLK